MTPALLLLGAGALALAARARAARAAPSPAPAELVPSSSSGRQDPELQPEVRPVPTPPPGPPPRTPSPFSDEGYQATASVVKQIPVVGPAIVKGYEFLVSALGLGDAAPYDPWQNPDSAGFASDLLRGIRDDILRTDPNGSTWTIRGITKPLTDANRPALIALQAEIRKAMAANYRRDAVVTPTQGSPAPGTVVQGSPPPAPPVQSPPPPIGGGTGGGTTRKEL